MTAAPLCPAGVRIETLRARLLLSPATAFWGALGLFLKLERRDAIETMATDGESLIYCAAFVDSLPDAELLGVIVHEIAHCTLRHHTRRAGRDPEQWNIAADYAENDWIISAGFKLPADALLDSRFAGMGAEEIYATRAAEARKRKQQQQQQNAAGNGAPQSAAGNGAPAPGQSPAPAPGQSPANASAGNAGAPMPGNASGNAPGAPGQGNAPAGSGNAPAAPGTPGNASAGNVPGNAPAAGNGAPADVRAPAWGKVLDAAPEHDAAGNAAADAAWQERVRAAVAVAARAMGAGNLPAAVRRLVAEIDKPRHNWRARVRQYADNGSRKEQTWARPARRYGASGLYLPAGVSVNPAHVVLCVDSSGSMDGRAVAESFNEAAAMLESGAVDRLTVLLCNAAVQRVREFTAANAAELAAFVPEPRGGTKFAPAFDWIRDNAADAAAVIYVTDLDCRDYGAPPRCPVLWLKTPGRPQPAPPFGEVMMLDPDA